MSGKTPFKRKSKMDDMLSCKRTKLLVCKGTDGSIQTRREDLAAVNSDHDYLPHEEKVREEG